VEASGGGGGGIFTNMFVEGHSGSPGGHVRGCGVITGQRGSNAGDRTVFAQLYAGKNGERIVTRRRDVIGGEREDGQHLVLAPARPGDQLCGVVIPVAIRQRPERRCGVRSSRRDDAGGDI